MKKSYLSDVPADQTQPSPQALEKINALARRPMRAEDVYVFPLKLCDNEIDRDCERLTVSALRELAALYVGKSGISDHDLRADNQCARIFDTRVCVDESRTTAAGERYTYLRAEAYIPRIEKYADLIGEIDSGIKKEVSIHCRCRSAFCSVCGADTRKTDCGHIPGVEYDGKRCHRILSGADDVYEWSFVAVPAQREAGVTKSYKPTEETSMQDILKSVRQAKDSLTLTAEELNTLRGAIDTLEQDAQAGKAYRAALTRDAVRYSAAALPEMSGECVQRICASMAADDLQTLCKHLRKAAEKHMPLTPQLHAQPEQNETNNAFMI